jgi:hypothetical protein
MHPFLFELIAYMFINNCFLFRSDFSYMFRPTDAIFKD